MVVAKKLKAYLDREKVRYHVLAHHERFTAPEIAEELHVPGHMMTKVVMVKANGNQLMVAIDAHSKIDMEALAAAVNADRVELASEKEFGARFPDCEVGAMPPFGNLYNVPVIVDRRLSEDEDIVFEAGSHHEAIKLAYTDFDRLVHPQVAEFGIRTEA